MKILVTGGTGQLGTELMDRCEQISDTEDIYYFTDINLEGESYLDVLDKESLEDFVDFNDIDVIVNCAGYTNVENAEEDFDGADLVNRKAVRNLAEIATQRDIFLIHISTDFVFSGKKSPILAYREDEEAKPLSVYGDTKLAGEQEIITSGAKYIIFRTAWLYSPYGHNFLKTMLRLTKENEEIKVVTDQIGTPTYAADLAEMIYYVISTRQFDKVGLYHFTNEGVASWFDFAYAIGELAGHDCNVLPCTTSEFPMKAERPSFSLLDKTLVKETFGITIPHWLDALKRAIWATDF